MKPLQVFVNFIALAVISVQADGAEFGSGESPLLLAQALKAPGTVETRTLKRLPPAITTRPRDPQAILKEECTWTNDNVANCLVWDCDDDGVCVELGHYCVDHYGNTIPCP